MMKNDKIMACKPTRLFSKVEHMKVSFQRIGFHDTNVPHHPQIKQKCGVTSPNTTKCTKYTQRPPQCVMSCCKRGMFGHRRVTSSPLHGFRSHSCVRDTIQGETLIILGLQCMGHNIHPMVFQAPMKVQVA
jgi:hypothetical protein